MATVEQVNLRLTLPNDGGQSTKKLTGRFLKKMARDLFSLPPELFGEDMAEIHGSVFRVLRDLGKERVLSIVRRPQVHSFLCCAVSALASAHVELARARARELLFQLTFELSLEGAEFGRPVVWHRDFPLPKLVSPTHRVTWTWSEGQERLRFPTSKSASPEPDAVPSYADFPELRQRFVMALCDSNPMSDFEAHPDKDGNQLSLGAASSDAWCDSLESALAIIEEFLPRLYGEMAFIHQQFVPVGTDDEQHLSASYQESIGTIYLTLHPQLMTMTEAVIHEFQHNKINMLFHLDRVMDNAFYPHFSSPVRPDPRPLHGVMLAAHAFVPVAELYKRLSLSGHPLSLRRGFTERFSHIVRSNSAALEVLVENALPTRLGQAVIDEMVDLNQEHRDYIGESL